MTGGRRLLLLFPFHPRLALQSPGGDKPGFGQRGLLFLNRFVFRRFQQPKGDPAGTFLGHGEPANPLDRGVLARFQIENLQSGPGPPGFILLVRLHLLDDFRIGGNRAGHKPAVVRKPGGLSPQYGVLPVGTDFPDLQDGVTVARHHLVTHPFSL